MIQFAAFHRLLEEYDPMVRWMAVIRAIAALGFALSMPFLAIYLHEDMNVSLTQIGLMLAVSGVVGSSAATIGGTLSDRFGRKPLLIRLLFLRAMVIIVLAYITWQRLPFLLFAAVHILSGLLGTSSIPVMDAIIADSSTPERRSDAYSLMRTFANLGWAIGPAIGGAIMALGYHWLFLATALFLIASALMAQRKIQETCSAPLSTGRPYNLSIVGRDRHLLLFLAIALAIFLAHGQLVATLSVHASSNVGLTKFQVGLLYLVNAGMVTVLQIPAMRLLNLIKPLQALAVSGMFYAVGYYIVGLAAGWQAMMTGVAVVTIGEIMEGPMGSSYVSKLAPAGMVGSYMGVFNLALHLGWTVGPLIGGFLLDHLDSPVDAWRLICILALMGSAGFVWLGRKVSKLAS
ncbi:MAG: MFS transporter, partial [Calditrichota bacterium]